MFHSEYADIRDEIVKRSPDGYYDAVFQHPMDFYRKRISMIGGTGHGHVLDAGHGFGQWSIALAEQNDHISAVDHNPPRCDISEVIKDHYGVSNLDILCAPLANLEEHFAPKSFDLIWCWGVIMFVDRSLVMPIFHRLLKDGGKLILGATNTPQRWRYKFQKGKRDQLDNPNFFKFCEQGMNGLNRENGVNAFGSTIEQNTPIADRYGFEVEYADYDGQIGLHGEEPLYFEPDVARENQNAEIVMRKLATETSG